MIIQNFFMVYLIMGYNKESGKVAPHVAAPVFDIVFGGLLSFVPFELFCPNDCYVRVWLCSGYNSDNPCGSSF